jgi:hypothetical protein
MHNSFKIIENFILLLFCSTCFGQLCVHNQELLIAAHAVSGQRVVLGRLFPPALLCYCQLAATYVCNTRSCKHSLDAPDDERKYRSKHVEQPRNNKLSFTVASCWPFSYIMNTKCLHMYVAAMLKWMP